MTTAVARAAEAIYVGWWENSDPDDSARWENLPSDDEDRLAATRSAERAFEAFAAVIRESLDGGQMTEHGRETEMPRGRGIGTLLLGWCPTGATHKRTVYTGPWVSVEGAATE